MANRTQTMSDDKTGAVGEQDKKCFRESRLGATVNVAGGFVQDQDARICHESASETTQLALPCRKSRTTLAHLSCQAIR